MKNSHIPPRYFKQEQMIDVYFDYQNVAINLSIYPSPLKLSGCWQLAAPNHRVHLCSRASFTCRQDAASNVLDIASKEARHGLEYFHSLQW